VHRLFSAVIGPVLDAVQPQTIVEVGSGQGLLTVRLLDAQRDALVHAIDPLPMFDATDLGRQHPGRLHLHRSSSHAALDALVPADVAILDGDPNFHTVSGELERLAAAASVAGRPGPVVIVHHVDWPFGQRDGYHDPERLPASAIHDPRASGLRLGHRDPKSDGLRLTGYCAASDQGDTNGVSRAVDAFVAERAHWRRVDVPGLHGVAVIASLDRLRTTPALVGVLDALEQAPFLTGQLRRLERERIAAVLGGAPEVSAVTTYEQDALRAERDQARREADVLQQQLEEAEAQLGAASAALAEVTTAAFQPATDLASLVTPAVPMTADVLGAEELTMSSQDVLVRRLRTAERVVSEYRSALLEVGRRRETLMQESARLRGELDATLRQLDDAIALAAGADARSRSAESQRDTHAAAAARDREALEEARAQILTAETRLSDLSGVRDDARRSREESARLASEIEHVRAQLETARSLLDDAAAARLTPRRARLRAAWTILRSRRTREAEAVADARAALESQVPTLKQFSARSDAGVTDASAD
jgi:hypothetical protein